MHISRILVSQVRHGTHGAGIIFFATLLLVNAIDRRLILVNCVDFDQALPLRLSLWDQLIWLERPLKVRLFSGREAVLFLLLQPALALDL